MRRSRHLLSGSQGPFFLWEGQRGRWHRRWGFMLVNIDSTGFLQSPNTLAPLFPPLSVPHFPGGIWSGLPNPSWVTSKGGCQAWIEAFGSFCLPSSHFHQAWITLPLPASPPSACSRSSQGFIPFTLSCRWRERSWTQFGHACWHRRLNAVCMTV